MNIKIMKLSKVNVWKSCDLTFLELVNFFILRQWIDHTSVSKCIWHIIRWMIINVIFSIFDKRLKYLKLWLSTQFLRASSAWYNSNVEPKQEFVFHVSAVIEFYLIELLFKQKQKLIKAFRPVWYSLRLPYS